MQPGRPTPASHQSRAAELAGRLRDIEAITDAALSRLDEQSMLNALLDRVRAILAADTAVVLLADQTAGHLMPAAASGIDIETWQDVRLPVGSGFAGRVAAERRPVMLDRAGIAAADPPLTRHADLGSLLGVPLLAGGKVLGVMHVGAVADHAFESDDIDLLRLAAERAALAVQALASQEDRLAAIALHRSLAPSRLPRLPGIDLAARYVTGQGNVGGDWYDVFVLPDGQLGIVIGDVAGSGMQAAVVMGRMRSALRAYLLETSDPADVLRRLDRKIQYFEPNAMATVFYGVYEPASGQLTASSAGHLPPVFAPPGGPPRLAEIEGDVPIGVADEPDRCSTVLELPPGSLLCCYTDGLVERRDKPLDAGIDRLAEVLGKVVAEPAPAVGGTVAENACGAVMRELVGSVAANDDIAVVMLYRHPAEVG